MPGTVRERVGKSGYQTGSIVERFHRADWDEYNYSAHWNDQSVMFDLVNAPENCQNMAIHRWRVLSGAITGTGALPGSGRMVEFSNYLPTRYSFGNGRAITHLIEEGGSLRDDQLQAAYTKFVNGVNPGRSEANLPVSLVELREVPQLIRSAKDLINVRRWRRMPLKQVADQYLANRFAYGPLASDMVTMLSLPEIISKRVRELTNLRDSGQVRRTRRLFSDSSRSVQTGVTAESWPFFMEYDEVSATAESVWGFVKQSADISFKALSDIQIRDIAKRAVIDGNLSINDLWELVPWSWLEDYFISAGDYFSYIGNQIPGIIDRGAVMCRTYKSKYCTPNFEVPPVKIPPVHLFYDRKYRLTGEPGIYDASFEGLSGSQLTIISALVGSSKAGYSSARF